MLRCCLWWPAQQEGKLCDQGQDAPAYRYRRGTAMAVLVEPFASVYDDRSRLGVILARGRGGFEAYAADDHSRGCFRALARPLPRSPRRARGVPKRPLRTSPPTTTAGADEVRAGHQPLDREGARPRCAG